MDESYIKAKGKWTYLYRAVNKQGETIDFYLSPSRDMESAEHFLRESIKNLKEFQKPQIINTGRHPVYNKVIQRLKETGVLPASVQHQICFYFKHEPLFYEFVACKLIFFLVYQ